MISTIEHDRRYYLALDQTELPAFSVLTSTWQMAIKLQAYRDINQLHIKSKWDRKSAILKKASHYYRLALDFPQGFRASFESLENSSLKPQDSRQNTQQYLVELTGKLLALQDKNLVQITDNNHSYSLWVVINGNSQLVMDLKDHLGPYFRAFFDPYAITNDLGLNFNVSNPVLIESFFVPKPKSDIRRSTLPNVHQTSNFV